MPIAVQCECGKQYKVGDDKAGMKLRCKDCKKVIAIPAGSGASGDDEWGDLGDDIEMPATPKPARSQSAKSKGRRGKKKSSSRTSKGGMSPAVKYGVAGGIVVVAAGAVLGILYSKGIIGGAKKKSEPAAEKKVADADTGSGGASTASTPPGDVTPKKKNNNAAQQNTQPRKAANGEPPIKPRPKKKKTADIPQTVALLQKLPVGDTSRKDKTIRIEGTVLIPDDRGYVVLDGDGKRVVCGHFPSGVQTRLAKNERVVMEGVFAQSNRSAIVLLRAKIVSRAASATAASAGTPRNAEFVKERQLIRALFQLGAGFPPRIPHRGPRRLRDVTGVNFISAPEKLADKDIAFLRKFPSLLNTDLTGQFNLTDKCVPDLVAMKQLKSIHLQSNKITDAGVALLANHTNLEHLGLEGASISDGALTHVAKLTKLKELWLSRTRVTDRALEHLTGLKNLERLYISETRATKDGFSRLQKALPKCKIFD